jgi:hypothetical protein
MANEKPKDEAFMLKELQKAIDADKASGLYVDPASIGSASEAIASSSPPSDTSLNSPDILSGTSGGGSDAQILSEINDHLREIRDQGRALIDTIRDALGIEE